jgi:hypothetical protein
VISAREANHLDYDIEISQLDHKDGELGVMANRNKELEDQSKKIMVNNKELKKR